MTHTDRSHGYVTDTSYADTFFRELSPVWINYVAALNGVLPRDLDRPFVYLELGCGFGSSTVVHAGACPRGEFHACDVNAAHIEGARRHAGALGIGNVRFHEASFDDLPGRDLPPCDFITLHGVYSWVAADVRRSIRRIIHEKLKPGGLVYVSYNCLPGWTVEGPLRRLLIELRRTAGGDPAQRTPDALRMLKELSAGKLRYFKANPSAAAAVDAYLKEPANYLAHEFLNQAWEPFYSVDVADEMAGADLSFVGSATLVDNHPTLVVDATAADAVARLPTPRQRQLAIDFAVNQRFRRDVFVRAGERGDPSAAARALHETVIGLPGDASRIGATARVPRGEIRFQEDFIRELQALLAHGSTPLGRAVTTLGGAGKDLAEIARNLMFLVAAGALMPFAKARPHDPGVPGRRLADPSVARALVYGRVRRVLPSEVLGSGIELYPVEALAVTAFLAGADTVDALAAQLADGITRKSLTRMPDGRDLQPGEDVAHYSRATAKHVIENLAPGLARLGLIIP